MSHKPRTDRKWLGALAVLAVWPHGAQAAAADDAALVEQGRYLSRAGDCIACHSVPNGQDFAGGLAMETPIGRIYSTNITPDKKTGIGEYSYADFDRAVREGVAKDGRHLYPAMPYPSYAKITDADMKALYAYFMQGVAPVQQANKPSEIPWLLSWRWPLASWNMVFSRETPYQPDPTRDAQWNRGAYLVQSLEHCGSCHTPRGLAFQEKAMGDKDGSAYLAGANIDGWHAKSLRGNDADGLGRWSQSDIVTFLKTGRTDKSAAFANMAEVVGHSTQYLSAEDLNAMAAYLKSLPARDGSLPPPAASSSPTATGGVTLTALRAGDMTQTGAAGYVEFCQSCHRPDGAGMPGIFPALAGNTVVTTAEPTSLVRITLAGGHMPKTASHAFAYAMPAFDKLNDQEIADIVTFIRNGWGNQASSVTAKQVAAIRADYAPAPQQAAPAAANDPNAPLKVVPPRDAAIPAGEEGQRILLGKRLLSETKRLLPDHVGDELNCTSCHLGEGKLALASPFVGVSVNYPRQNPRAGRVVSLEDRINGCFLRSMNGKPVPADSAEMKAMVAYFNWLSQGLPKNANVAGKGVGKIDDNLTPDPTHGKQVYDAQCAQCHGKDGEGMRDAKGEMVFPPLWGDQSFNIGAGMARTYTAAAFVKNNMPIGHGLNARLGQGGMLSDQDAVDVAEYFSHQPRPDFAPKVKDWPNGGKPKDARY